MTYDLDAACRLLSQTLRPCPWYHRSSMFQEGSSGNWLVVWGDQAERPAEIPEFFGGYRVFYHRVDRQHPCPFGSVKE